MALRPIYDPEHCGSPMKVAIFLSGSGTNAEKIIERERELKEDQKGSPFEVIFIFSDNQGKDCKGQEIARRFGLPYFSYDIVRFYKSRGRKKSIKTGEDLRLRKEFDSVPKTLIRAFNVDMVALCGYMSYTTIKGCINVHPADLSILDDKGRRRYVGDHAVRDAILAGEKELRSSTILIDEGVDTGPLLMVSAPLKVELPTDLENLRSDSKKLEEVVKDHQERLKRIGDWKILPRTIELISLGRFQIDEGNRIYLDGRPVPLGYRE